MSQDGQVPDGGSPSLHLDQILSEVARAKTELQTVSALKCVFRSIVSVS
jgi:hypothetical protein